MTDSERWAGERLERANAIFEPDQKSWRGQLIDVLVWAAELALVWWLVSTFWGPLTG